MIQILQTRWTSKTEEVSLVIRGINISLAATSDLEGNRSLKLRMGGVGAAVLITDSPMESATISIVDESTLGVGVSIQGDASIYVGRVPNATEKGT